MDHLEDGHQRAMKLLLGTPDGAELSLEHEEDQLVWLGMGLLIGKGLAAYRGDYCFRLKRGKREHLESYLAEYT